MFWQSKEVKQHLKWVFVLLSLYVIQILFSEIARIGNSKPDFLLVGLFFFAVNNPQTRATWVGFCVGLLEDLFLAQMFGLMAFCKTLAGFLFWYLTPKKHNLILYLGSFLLFSFFHFLIFDFVYLGNLSLEFWEIIVKHSIPNSLYSLLLVVIWIIYRQVRR